MRAKTILLTIGKLLLGALLFFAGTLLGSLLAGVLDLPVPALPEGADVETLLRYQLLTGFLFTAVLVPIARNLTVGFLARWFVLAAFSWLTFSLNTYLEAAIFTAYEAASTYTLLMQLCAILLSSAAVAWLFPAIERGLPLRAQLREFAAQYNVRQWAWRLLLAFLAFPPIYIVFGLLAHPFVVTYYEQQMAGLTLPGWGEILPVLFLRSLLFLLACLPLLAAWQASRKTLFITLGGALFMMVGGLYMLQATWLPVSMRLVHALEILADSFIYAGVLVALLTARAAGETAGEQAGQLPVRQVKPS